MLLERVDQEGLNVLLHERREHEQAPDAVDDAGDAGQQLDGDADRPAQHHRAELGQEERDHQADRHGDQHGDGRGDQRAVDRRQRAEALGDRVPRFVEQEGEAEGAERRRGADDQGDDDTAQQRQHRASRPPASGRGRPCRSGAAVSARRCARPLRPPSRSCPSMSCRSRHAPRNPWLAVLTRAANEAERGRARPIAPALSGISWSARTGACRPRP